MCVERKRGEEITDDYERDKDNKKWRYGATFIQNLRMSILAIEPNVSLTKFFFFLLSSVVVVFYFVVPFDCSKRPDKSKDWAKPQRIVRRMGRRKDEAVACRK